eukprot:15461201-Alexandrium_andersonii.AAC.1
MALPSFSAPASSPRSAERISLMTTCSSRHREQEALDKAWWYFFMVSGVAVGGFSSKKVADLEMNFASTG